jgi:hypothetical protein
MDRRSPALAVALLLVLAGCAAPVGSGPPPEAADASTPPTPETPAGPETPDEADDGATEATVTVEGGELPVDAAAVYDRVQNLSGLEGESVRVEVVDPRDDRVRSPAPDIHEPLGLTGGSFADIGCGPAASASAGDDVVRIVTEGLSPAEVELVLVHEYVHVLQNDNDLTAPRGASGWESLYVRTSLIEGAAVYLADAYAQEYDLNWSGDRRPLELRRCFYERAPPGAKTLTAVYHFGGEYFADAVDDPTDLAAAYERLPNTTEGVLRGDAGPTDPPAPLTVDVESDAWDDDGLGTYGALTLRVALATELNESRAAAAAEGGGHDAAVELDHDDRTGFVWVQRWDDPGEAREFLVAAEAYAAARRDAGTPIRVVRVGPETTALVLGDEELLAAATLTVDGETVTVTVIGSDASVSAVPSVDSGRPTVRA